MMDGSQELMTFRAGEVLGDLETPDASGQCGSFPFDVVACEEGCRVALFPEPTASAVLARSHDIGSRFFRLLRDRLRLALWHYDIRELVGEYLECGNERLEKRLLHRCARALLWAAAIESRGRTTAFGEEIAFLDPETIARRFKPGTERIDFGVVIRQLHLLRMIDAFPGAALRKEEEARASASWEALVASATRIHLLADALDPAAPGNREGPRRPPARLAASSPRTATAPASSRTSSTTWPPPSRAPAFRERLDRWSAYIARAHRFWEDRNPWLIVLRDVPALRRIALGDAGQHRPDPRRPRRIPPHRIPPPHLGPRHRPGLPRPPQGVHRHPRRLPRRRPHPRTATSPSPAKPASDPLPAAAGEGERSLAFTPPRLEWPVRLARSQSSLFTGGAEQRRRLWGERRQRRGRVPLVGAKEIQTDPRQERRAVLAARCFPSPVCAPSAGEGKGCRGG